MDWISKIMRILCWWLILALLSKGSKSDDGLVPKTIPPELHKLTIQITNQLHVKDPQLFVHCKDKKHDVGPVTLKFGESFHFRIRENFWFPTALYFCHFVWPGADYHFDIYVQSRDLGCHHYKCYWEIYDSGPCGTILQESGSTVCFPWNKK